MRSPTSGRARTADATIALQVTQFFDDWHYRIMRTSVAKSWSREKVVVKALELFALNGLPLTEQDIKRMSRLHEETMISEVVQTMPSSMRQNFESLSDQLKMLLNTAVRVRLAVDKGSDEDISQVMDEEDRSLVKDQILKAAVLHASKESAHLSSCRATWMKSTEDRLSRLTRSAEMAADAQQQLLKVEAQLDRFPEENKAKSTKALMGFVASSEANLVHSTFVTWAGYTIKTKHDRDFRKTFEDELIAKETLLIDMRKKVLENVKKALHNQMMEGNADLTAYVLRAWQAEIGATKQEQQEMEEVKKLEEQMSKFAQEQSATARKVMARMNADSEETTLVSIFAAWVASTAASKSEKEIASMAARSDDQYKAYMDKRKDSTKAMLARMTTASNTGLLRTSLTSWHATARELVEARRIESTIAAADTKFKVLKSRQKSGAAKLQSRVTDQMRANLIVRVLGAWELTTKLNRIEKYYTSKMEGKRRQLESVKNLFSTFADSLEEGLGGVDGDSSCRGETRARRSKQLLQRGAEHSVSLPEIRLPPGRIR